MVGDVPYVEVLGVHAVDAPDPCHLIEVVIRNCSDRVDLAEITQDGSPLPRSEWQAPYDEHLVVQGELVSLWQPVAADVWHGDVRLAFFLHYVELDRPMRTPFGDVMLPRESPVPSHLEAMHYEQPRWSPPSLCSSSASGTSAT